MILKTFEQTGIGKLRAVIIEGEPWFLGIDVGVCLGYTNPRRAYLDHTEEKYRKTLFYKGYTNSGLSKLWLSMYEILEKELDEVIRKTKPKRKEYQPDTGCWAHYFWLYLNENTFSDTISFGSLNPNSYAYSQH